ncbi:nuclear pore membrane glycoprotein 210-like [Plakobranchus ocellatus]|uniref:Nuclear pore membrane glycoprotein 210-like n=1 Tax=Plakobranchus ocellatus TaxID=259542 RepID=A0AAV3ZM05_9GAST|nr:nuclear pore membrane glycoprotein 210-like [Plakobranchus ocellatus]
MVIANLMLSPPDAYVLPLGRVKYTVELLRHNSLKEIKMPSKQYYLEVKDRKICRLDMQTSMATALELGATEVVLKDRNIVVTEFFRQPSAMIHVVTPGFLAFVVLPHRKWVLETGREYEIIIEIYDTDSHKIYPSDNVRVVAEFPEAYFKVLHSSVNGTYHRVRTLLKGETIIDGALVSVVDEAGEEHVVKPEVKRSQDVEIFDPITVTPAQVFFPWDPVTRCVHRYMAQANGGSGEYIWSLTNTSVASVNIKGQITTVGPGKCNVTAADAKNSAHFGVSTVQVLAPADIQFSPTKVEAAIGSELILPVSVFARIGRNTHAFTDCRQLPLNVSFSEASVFEHVSRDDSAPLELPETGCTSLTFLAKRQGHTEVIVTYQSKNVMLQASLTVAAYNPLMAVDPESEAVIALGSSKEVLFHGGPQPWVLDSSKFFQLLTPEKEELVKVTRPSHYSVNRGVHSFIVSCQDFGEQEIQLSVGNGATAKNKFPVTDVASIRFSCARPVELHLQPSLHLNPNLPPCPVPHENNLPMPVHYNKDLDLLVTVTDSSGRRFDNFSSLDLSWTLSTSSLAELLHARGDLRTDVQVEPSGRKILSNYQTMRPHKEQGSVIIQASIERYKSYVFAKLAKKPQEKIIPVISKSLELLLVQEAELSPSTLSVFNHPSNQVMIGILHGSGYFYIEEFQSQVITATYDHKHRGIQVTPQKDGLHSFYVYDLCLEVTAHPIASVSVSGVGSVQVNVIEKMEVQKEVLATVQVLDLRGKPLLASFFSLMGLKLEAASDIISLRPVTGQVDDGVTGVYTVYGAMVGHTTLTASVRLPTGQVIYSAPKPLEVFPPLRLDPKNITLIIGAKLQVLAFGGPQPQSNVEFSILDSRISTVTGGGMLDAMEIGSTRVIGRAVGTDPLSGEKVIYSQDDAIVNVVTLRGIRIYTPLTRIQTGTQMPVYAVGLTDHETPFTFGNSVPPLTFSWSANSREVLQLHSVYHQSAIEPLAENNFAQRAVAEATGHSTIRLRVRVNPGSRLQIHMDQVLQDEVQIQVFEKLALINPSACHGQILITPNTDTFLKTNRDVAARVRYYILNKEEVATDSKNVVEAPIVRLLDNGQLRSGPIPGSAVLHVVAVEEFGLNQTLVILVKVKPVSYMMINSDSVVLTSPSSHLTTVPIGASLQFQVSYHDDVGDEFYSTNVELGIRCSRYDLLHVSNGVDNVTLVVRAAEIGNTVLKVWDKKKPSMTDYVNIPVGYAISPAQVSVTLGSIVCFSSVILTETGSPGSWKSKSKVLAVEEQFGIATARYIGHAELVYSFSTFTSTNTEVTVEPITMIYLGQGATYLTNAGNGKTRSYPVYFNKEGNLMGQNCSSVVAKTNFSPSFIPYKCELELTQRSPDIGVADLFMVRESFVPEKGLHMCEISPVLAPQTSPLQSADPLAQLAASLESNLKLTARVHESSSPGQREVSSEAMELDFLPAFYVHNPELHLSTAWPVASVRVTATRSVIENLQIKVSDSTIIESLGLEKDATNSNIAVFPVRLLDSLTLWEKELVDISVEVSHARSGHKLRVPIYVKLIGQKPDVPYVRSAKTDLSWSYILISTVSNYQSWLVICFIILITAAAVLIGYHAIVGPRYKTSNNPDVFLNQSGRNLTPSSSFIQQSSPIASPSPPPYTGRSSPTSPKLWSVSYNQQDTRNTPYRRSPFAYTPKS